MKSPNYNRMGFKEEKLGVEELMSSEFTSSLIKELRDNKGTITRGDVTIRLGTLNHQLHNITVHVYIKCSI